MKRIMHRLATRRTTSWIGPVERTHRGPTRGGNARRGTAADPGRARQRQDPGRYAPGGVAAAPGHPRPQILALTFTNKAADEMAFRIERLADDPSVWVGTFHRFCARLLRQYAPLVGLQENYTIYDVRDSVRALRQAVGRMKIDLDRYPPESLARAISWAKNNVIGPDAVPAAARPRAGQHRPEGLPGLSAPVGHLERRRFRRPAAPRGRHSARQSRDSRGASTSATASSWSTSTRTPTWPNTPSLGRCRSIIPTWPSPATPTNRSTAGAGPT